MANSETIKTTIDANINTNGNQAITGAVMNSVLKQMVDSTDAQLTELSEEITSQLFEKGNVSEGNEVANDAVYRSLYIPCKKGDVINGQIYRVKVYNADYMFLAEEGTTLSGAMTDYVVQNDNCAYVRIVILTQDKDNCTILINGVNAEYLIAKNLFDKQRTLESGQRNVIEDISELSEGVGEIKSEITDLYFERGAIGEGNEIDNATVSRSAYIKVKKGDVISGYIYRVKLYDNNLAYLGEAVPPANANATIDFLGFSL